MYEQSIGLFFFSKKKKETLIHVRNSIIIINTNFIFILNINQNIKTVRNYRAECIHY